MCGITGIFHRKGGSPDPKVLDAMTDRLVHRGPDGRGTYFFEGAAFGHRRLSIIGLSTGAQPLANETRDVWVTYNGEIYNHLALRRELEHLGHTFRTQTDTEILVHGWEAWGTKLVDRLRGIFAFVIHDQKKGEMFAVRDRLGVKPLYYRLTPELFLFASEPKALLVHPDTPKRPSPEGIRLYVQYRYVPAPYTAFDGMKQLDAGSHLLVSREKEVLTRYWEPPEIGSGNPKNAEAELDRQVDDTVEIELMSEVPLGAFLSGGVDSSVVAASIAKNPRLTRRPRTFCIGFPEPEYDESPHSKRIAESLGLDHHVEVVSTDALGLLDTLVEIYDEPFADSSAIPTYVLCKMAKKHVTVALSGDGGDELFGGYRRYQKLFDYRELPSPLRDVAGLIHQQVPSGVRGRERLERLSQTLPYQYEFEVSGGRKAAEEMLLPEYRVDVDWSIASLFERAPCEMPVQKAQWVDLMSYLPNDILTKVDRASMSNSLEVRVPLLDHVFVEWVATLPPEKGFGNGEMKVALKEHLARRVPKPLFDRPKQGFGVPLEYWLHGTSERDGGGGAHPDKKDGLAGIASKLRDRHPKKGLYSPIREEAFAAKMQRHGREDMSSSAWQIVFLEAWWQKHFV
jgi:asparagine synthase (glutamine-hydrolysing)